MAAPPATAVVIRTIAPAATYALRHAVLWPDQPPEFVRLAEDAAGYHYGAFVPGEAAPVAVSSLFVAEGVGRFRKFATQPAWQRRGIGTAVLRHVVAEARRLGARTLWCDARQAAAVFYERFGMVPVGEVFYKGPIPYSRYELALE